MSMARTLALTTALLTGSGLSYANDIYVGSTCGLNAVPDPNAANERVGAVTGGPITVTNGRGGTVQSVTITCTVQMNNPNPGGVGVSRTSTTQGAVGVLGDTIRYTRMPGDVGYLCTQFSWASSKGGGSQVYDADPTTPGQQCFRF